MVSTKAQLYTAYLRATGQKRFYDDARALRHRLHRHQRPSMARPPRRLRRTCTIERQDVRGFPCWTLRPRRGATAGTHVLHLHGGGYVEEIETHHWSFAADLVDRLGRAVTLPIYPLVPRHDHTETRPMVYAAYERIADDRPAEDLVVSGDSAGGALALAIAQRLREAGRMYAEGTEPHDPRISPLHADLTGLGPFSL